MPTYEKASSAVAALAQKILAKHETHAPVLVAGVTFDFVFAHADLNEDSGEPKNFAITKDGHRALGVTRITPLPDRALGMADARITLDGDWWKDAEEKEREGLLDHELHHVSLKLRKGSPCNDDLGRPELKLRRHNIQFGWFNIVAFRNGAYSQERIQAKAIMEEYGQLYFPEIAGRTVDEGERAARAVRQLQVA
jgi:hypothetical protein